MKERDEQIAKKARKLAIQYTKDYDDEGKEVYNIGTEVACLEMAEWIDAHSRKGLVDIDKACEWLECNAAYYLNSINASDNPTSLSTPRYIGAWLETDRLIEDFKKAMEGMYNIKSK